jgi:hypothetical protein
VVALSLVALAGCGPGDANLSYEMQVFSARQPAVDAFKSLDNTLVPLESEATTGENTVYALNRYQWSRLKEMALKNTDVQRTFSDTVLIKDSEDYQRTANCSDGARVAVSLIVVPESCCMFTLQRVAYTVADAKGQSAIVFSCMYPITNNILVQLPPTSPGGRFTWILMDVQKIVN